MMQISLKLTEVIYKKLEERESKKGEKNVSQSIRELIELGLRVEEAAEKNEGDTKEINLIDEILSIKTMLEYDMTWSLEGRTYARHLMEFIPGKTPKEILDLVNMIKGKAKKNIKEREYILEGKP